MEEGKKLPRVPESLLKRRKAYQAIKAKQAQDALLNKKRNKEKRKIIFKRAEQYAKEYRQKERSDIRLARYGIYPVSISKYYLIIMVINSIL